MKIQALSANTLIYRQNPNFTSNNRLVYNTINGKEKLIYKNNSCYFRDDLNWQKFTDFIIKKYQGVEKVNLYSYGCSEGAEPFSIAMLLMEKLGLEKAKKFFPILASDIDKEIIKNPQQGIIKVSDEDLEYIKKTIGNNYNKYINLDNKFKKDLFLKDTVYDGTVKPILKDAVIFKNNNIANDIQNIEPNNSIVVCKNFLNYYDYYEEQKPLVKKLSERLNENSFCLLGDFDGYDTVQLFKEYGFNETDIFFLLEKKTSFEKTSFNNPFLFFSNFMKKK